MRFQLNRYIVLVKVEIRLSINELEQLSEQTGNQGFFPMTELQFQRILLHEFIRSKVTEAQSSQLAK